MFPLFQFCRTQHSGLQVRLFSTKMCEGFNEVKRIEHQAQDPFTMYLGGEAGTGKTRVVEALQFFCEKAGASQVLYVHAHRLELPLP